jgi:UPF0176 protein
MSLLHNRINSAELKQQLAEEPFARTTISFYRYFHIGDPQLFRDRMYEQLFALKVFGRIYIAREGINAQISVPAHHFQALKDYLHSVQGLENLRLNVAVDDDGKSFYVLKMKVREKIVADGLPADFDVNNRGSYVDARAMNELMQDPNTIVVDMRNHYEFEVGHFDHALQVPSDTFRDQLPMAKDMLAGKEDRQIVMYCTGGIRCEKASAYLLQNGFAHVHHLEGGIINYARQIKAEGLPSAFKGKNFVFDERMGERITEDVLSQCHQCGAPCDSHTNCLNDGCHLLFIQCPSCAEQFQGCCTQLCADVRAGRAEAPPPVPGKAFNKSQQRLRPRLGRQA